MCTNVFDAVMLACAIGCAGTLFVLTVSMAREEWADYKAAAVKRLSAHPGFAWREDGGYIDGKRVVIKG